MPSSKPNSWPWKPRFPPSSNGSAKLETRADAAEDEAIACKYEAARLIFEELERREGGARALGEEIGKSHTHVLRMERMHRKYGNKPPVRSLSEWNKLYRGDGPQAVSLLKPRGHVKIRTVGLEADVAIEVKEETWLTWVPSSARRRDGLLGLAATALLLSIIPAGARRLQGCHAGNGASARQR